MGGRRAPPPAKPAQRRKPGTTATPAAAAPLKPWGEVFGTPKEETAPTVSLENIEDIRDQLPADFNEKSERVQRALVKRVRDQQAATLKSLKARKEAEAKAAARQAAKEKV